MRNDPHIAVMRATAWPTLQCGVMAAMLMACMLLLPAAGHAHQLSVTECVEGGDFIKHAALARNNGISETGFLDRVRSDIEMIQAFPPQLRWFVQDDDDAQFLLGAVVDVFRKPKAASVHQADFFKACLGKTGDHPRQRL